MHSSIIKYIMSKKKHQIFDLTKNKNKIEEFSYLIVLKKKLFVINMLIVIIFVNL